MNFTTIKIAGADTIQTLDDYRSRYPQSGQYPFLIGDLEELERIQEAASFNEQDPAAIIQGSLGISIADWIGKRRKEIEDDGLNSEEVSGEWPGEILEKGSIGLHKDILTGETKAEIYLGLASIEEPWHLPAILKYGAWNDCPESEVHCAFHREWQASFGAQITGVSGDVVECFVAKPPKNRDAAMKLAYEQYWYCTDIVEQGCGSVVNLAATLLNSPYWYFWWD
jgi:hypothetical protein